MTNTGPQSFEIPISDQLFQTLNPADPIIGIASSALVPVTIPWNKERTALAKDADGEDKEVVFGKIKWSGAKTGPHPVFEEQLLGQRVKVGTISWAIETVVHQQWQQHPDLHAPAGFGRRHRGRQEPPARLRQVGAGVRGIMDPKTVVHFSSFIVHLG